MSQEPFVIVRMRRGVGSFNAGERVSFPERIAASLIREGNAESDTPEALIDVPVLVETTAHDDPVPIRRRRRIL